MEAICGANCEECSLYQKTCKGCKETNGCPFGKKCWIAKYIEVGGKESFTTFKKQLIEEINSLNIDGLPTIEELYPLHGAFVNLEYVLPNQEKVKFLNDEEAYLGNQVECIFNEKEKRYFGVLASTNFILISEYGENGDRPELILYKKR